MDDFAGIQRDLPQKQGSGADSGVWDPGPPEVLPPIPVGPPDVTTPGRKKRGGANIVRINAAKQLRSADKSMQLKELICEHGMSIGKAAKEIGIGRRHAARLWAVWVERLRRIREGTDEEVKKGVGDVLTYCDHHVRGTIERCAAMLEDSPAYAAGLLRGIELLTKLHRINLDAPGNAGTGGQTPIDEILQQAKDRADTQIVGLAVDVSLLALAEQEIAKDPKTVGINNELRHAGGS